jgi:hypothetical protein
MVSSLDFLVVMAVLYLVECVRRVGPDELTLDRRVLSGFRLKRPAPYPNDARWGWVLLNPFRPDGPTFSLMLSPGALTHSGRMSGEKTSLRNLDPTRFDVDAINEAFATIRKRTSGLRRLVLVLLAVWFGLFPACLFCFGLRATLPPAAAVVFALSVCAAALYQRNAKLIFPTTTILDLYGKVMKFVLYPISAIRCMDCLSRDAMAAFDPIAVTALLCGHERSACLAARELIILRCGIAPQNLDFTAGPAITEYRAARHQLLESFATQLKLPVQAFMDPPVQADNACKTYCPVCRAQFRLSEGVCPDCPDVFLQVLGDPSASRRLAPAATSRTPTSQRSVTVPPASCIPLLKGHHHHEQQNG